MADEKEEGSTVRDALENAVIETVGDKPEPQLQEGTVEVAAPETWSDDDKKVFGEVTDPKIKKWLLDRDAGYTTKFTETENKVKEYEEKYKGFDELFAPYQDRLTEAKQLPVDVIKNLLTAQTVIEQKPLEGMMWLVKHYGIDAAALAKALGGQPLEEKPAGEVDPLADLDPSFAQWLKDLQKKVEGASTFAETAVQQDQLKIKEKIDNDIKEFRTASDPKTGMLLYPYMANKAVTDYMGMLLKTKQVDFAKEGGVIPGFKKAYDQAVYAIPEIRAELLKDKPAETVTADRLKKAKRAGAGVSGVSASTASPSAKGTVREQLEAAARGTGMIT